MIRVSSIFSQTLQLFSRAEFERAVREHRGEHHARGSVAGASLWRCFSAIWVTIQWLKG